MTFNNQQASYSPESQGISSAAIFKFVEAAEHDLKELHSFILVRHGAIVAKGWWSPYGAQLPHMLFSLSKSFTSTELDWRLQKVGCPWKIESFLSFQMTALEK
jgi:hypothetical protein